MTKNTNTEVTGPIGLPEGMEAHVITVEEHKDGGWTFPTQLGLDIEVEAVQELAYHLMTTSAKASIAMMGRPDAKPNDDRPNRISLGNDGRWFASTAQVRKAASAWIKAHGELDTWVKPRGTVPAETSAEDITAA